MTRTTETTNKSDSTTPGAPSSSKTTSVRELISNSRKYSIASNDVDAGRGAGTSGTTGNLSGEGRDMSDELKKMERALQQARLDASLLRQQLLQTTKMLTVGKRAQQGKMSLLREDLLALQKRVSEERTAFELAQAKADARVAEIQTVNQGLCAVVQQKGQDVENVRKWGRKVLQQRTAVERFLVEALQEVRLAILPCQHAAPEVDPALKEPRGTATKMTRPGATISTARGANGASTGDRRRPQDLLMLLDAADVVHSSGQNHNKQRVQKEMAEAIVDKNYIKPYLGDKGTSTSSKQSWRAMLELPPRTKKRQRIDTRGMRFPIEEIMPNEMVERARSGRNDVPEEKPPAPTLLELEDGQAADSGTYDLDCMKSRVDGAGEGEDSAEVDDGYCSSLAVLSPTNTAAEGLLHALEIGSSHSSCSSREDATRTPRFVREQSGASADVVPKQGRAIVNSSTKSRLAQEIAGAMTKAMARIEQSAQTEKRSIQSEHCSSASATTPRAQAEELLDWYYLSTTFGHDEFVSRITEAVALGACSSAEPTSSNEVPAASMGGRREQEEDQELLPSLRDTPFDDRCENHQRPASSSSSRSLVSRRSFHSVRGNFPVDHFDPHEDPASHQEGGQKLLQQHPTTTRQPSCGAPAGQRPASSPSRKRPHTADSCYRERAEGKPEATLKHNSTEEGAKDGFRASRHKNNAALFASTTTVNFTAPTPPPTGLPRCSVPARLRLNKAMGSYDASRADAATRIRIGDEVDVKNPAKANTGSGVNNHNDYQAGNNNSSSPPASSKSQCKKEEAAPTANLQLVLRGEGQQEGAQTPRKVETTPGSPPRAGAAAAMPGFGSVNQVDVQHLRRSASSSSSHSRDLDEDSTTLLQQNQRSHRAAQEQIPQAESSGPEDSDGASASAACGTFVTSLIGEEENEVLNDNLSSTAAEKSIRAENNVATSEGVSRSSDDGCGRGQKREQKTIGDEEQRFLSDPGYKTQLQEATSHHRHFLRGREKETTCTEDANAASEMNQAAAAVQSCSAWTWTQREHALKLVFNRIFANSASANQALNQLKLHLLTSGRRQGAGAIKPGVPTTSVTTNGKKYDRGSGGGARNPPTKNATFEQQKTKQEAGAQLITLAGGAARASHLPATDLLSKILDSLDEVEQVSSRQKASSLQVNSAAKCSSGGEAT
ncbi:unnamed protein product [Amoebophrya sp. A120]|nr:unnamed protein product [Amoebophrya sp. A120]|eukprot:GSA120T00012698001.1